MLAELDPSRPIEARFHIIAPHATEILGDDDANLASIDVRYELLPAGTLEVAAAEAVVCVVTAIGEAVLASIAFKLPLLIGDGV